MLIGLCVCASVCTIVVHNTAQNSSYGQSSLPIGGQGTLSITVHKILLHVVFKKSSKSAHLLWSYHGQYTVSQKTSHLWLAITLTHMNGFWYFFGRNVTNKVGNQKMLYYATSSNLCFCTTWQNGQTRKSHFHSVGLCYTHNARVRCLLERKSCHMWCVW